MNAIVICLNTLPAFAKAPAGEGGFHFLLFTLRPPKLVRRRISISTLMKTALQFEFSVDKGNKTILVSREFDANLGLVWDAWTKAELLDQWWAPKPYRVETKLLDFTEGGTWLYSMISPTNERHWSRADFQKIETRKSFSSLDAFCDENGNRNPQMSTSVWTNHFSEADETTVVDVSIVFDRLSDLEQMIQMGFKEGFTMCLGNLDELLEKFQKKIG